MANPVLIRIGLNIVRELEIGSSIYEHERMERTHRFFRFTFHDSRYRKRVATNSVPSSTNCPDHQLHKQNCGRRGRYTIITDSIQIELIVHDVSVARRVLKVEIGLSGGARQSVQIEVNKETPVILGAKVYVLTANEVYDINPGPDIAALSIVEKRS